MQFNSTFRSAKNIIVSDPYFSQLKQIVSTKCLVVLSKSLLEVTEIQRRIQKFSAANVVEFYFKDWEGEPQLNSVKGLVSMMEDFGPDLIIAIGGGSLIDGVKFARVLFEHPDIVNDRIVNGQLKVPSFLITKMVVVPTTIGTGSEVSSSAVVMNDQFEKIFYVGHSLIADYVFFLPELIYSLPLKIALSTIADSIAHCVEGYVSIISNPIAEDFAIRGLTLINENWRVILENPTKRDSTLNLMIASLYGGYAQNHCLVGASHAIAHAYAYTGLAHGEANAIFLPYVIELNSEKEEVSLKYDYLANMAGFKNGIKGLLSQVKEISEIIGDNRTIKNLPQAKLLTAVNDIGGRANPIPLELNLLRTIEEMANN
jgi:alcohol dehydrogenase class IV